MHDLSKELPYEADGTLQARDDVCMDEEHFYFFIWLYAMRVRCSYVLCDMK